MAIELKHEGAHKHRLYVVCDTAIKSISEILSEIGHAKMRSKAIGTIGYDDEWVKRVTGLVVFSKMADSICNQTLL